MNQLPKWSRSFRNGRGDQARRPSVPIDAVANERAICARQLVDAVLLGLEQMMGNIMPMTQEDLQFSSDVCRRLVRELDDDVRRGSNVHLLSILIGMRCIIDGELQLFAAALDRHPEVLETHSLNVSAIGLMEAVKATLNDMVVVAAQGDEGCFREASARWSDVSVEVYARNRRCAYAAAAACCSAVLEEHACRVVAMI